MKLKNEAAAGPIYVAIRPTSDAKIWISATASTKKYAKTLTKTYAANNGYNVTWKMGTVGDVILSDGTFAKAGTSGAVAKICYIGNDAETSVTNTTYKHGLALAMSDGRSGSKVQWDNAHVNTCLTDYDDLAHAKTDMAGIANTTTLVSDGHGHTAAYDAQYNNGTSAPTGTSGWFLPSAGQWDKMIGAYGSENLRTTSGGYTGLRSGELDDYWSSTESDANYVWDIGFYYDDWNYAPKENGRYVRACLAF